MCIAAVVWNFGEHAPEAQITLETGFLLQGDSDLERVADTGPVVEVRAQRGLLARGDHQRRGARVLGGRSRRQGQRGGIPVGLGDFPISTIRAGPARP